MHVLYLNFTLIMLKIVITLYVFLFIFMNADLEMWKVNVTC